MPPAPRQLASPFPFSFPPNAIHLFHRHFETRVPVSKTGKGLSVLRGFESPPSPLTRSAALRGGTAYLDVHSASIGVAHIRVPKGIVWRVVQSTRPALNRSPTSVRSFTIPRRSLRPIEAPALISIAMI